MDAIKSEVIRIVSGCNSPDQAKTALERIGLVRVVEIVYPDPKNLSFEVYSKLREQGVVTLRSGLPVSIMYISPCGAEVV